MKMIDKYLILLIFMISSFLYSVNYPYKVPGNDEEYFLNPLVNYAFTFETEEIRNDSLYTNSFIKLTAASTSNKLL